MQAITLFGFLVMMKRGQREEEEVGNKIRHQTLPLKYFCTCFLRFSL